MPQNARIHQTDVTADYANTVLWEAGEEGSDYGSVTVGIQEDLYAPAGGLRMSGTWVNSFQLIAKVGEEAHASDITQGAGFIAGTGQFIDVRVPNGEFKNIRIEGTFLRIVGTSTNTKLTNCVARGMIQPSIADDLVLDNTLFLSDGIADSISIRDTPTSLNKSTVVSLNDTGGHVVRSRGSAVIASDDSVCFAPNTATSFLAFIGGTFSGDFNAGHTGGSTPGGNSITNLTRTISDVFTDPSNDDYTPKVGGPLDGASSSGGFIGAFAPTSSGISITPSTVNSSSVSLNPTIEFNSLLQLTPATVNSSSISLDPVLAFSSVLTLTPSTVNSSSVSLNPTILFSGVLEISAVAINSSSVSLNPSIQFSSSLNLTPSVVNTLSVALNPFIEYTSALVIAPQTINSASISIDPLIEFKSVVNLTPGTINSLSVSNNPFITTGQVQKIGSVTAGFADDLYSVKYKLSGITVNFKE